MKLKKLTYVSSILLNFAFILLSHAQNITFLEAEFKSQVIRQGFDTNEDGEISVSEANLVKALELRNLGIRSLDDLNHFQNLEVFKSTSLLEIETIELKNFQNLRSFYLENSLGAEKPISFVIEGLPQLDSFTLKAPVKLIEFDTLPNLHYFEVINKYFTKLLNVDNFNLPNLPNIEVFILGKCKISHLDFSDNFELRSLTVCSSTLSTINLFGNPKLKYLDLSSCKIAAIDLSNNQLLETLDLNFNLFSNVLKISDLPRLKYINASYNGLNNIELTNLDSLEILNINNNNISNFNQIFVNLKQLHVIGNDFQGFDARQFPRLQELYCLDIKAQNLNLSDFSELRHVGCGGEDLKEITFGENPNLEEIYVEDSNLTAFEITDKYRLNKISLFRNYNLEEVTLKNLPMLNDVSIYVNSVNYFNAKEINHLSTLRLERNNLSAIDLSGIKSIDNLNLGSNAFTTFSLGDVQIIEVLDLDNNPLVYLDFKSIKEIPIISLNDVLLSTINLSQSKTWLLKIDKNPNLDTLVLNNGIYTTVSNESLHQTNLHTPNLKYICIDSSEQFMIQTILDQSGISANIEIECEDFTTSLTENPLADLKIYPNPAGGEFSIQLAGKNKVSVFSSDGRMILDELMNNELKISNLASGCYFIQIYSFKDGKTFLSKIIIQH